MWDLLPWLVALQLAANYLSILFRSRTIVERRLNGAASDVLFALVGGLFVQEVSQPLAAQLSPLVATYSEKLV